MAEVLGCSTAHEVWIALESAFSHSSKSRELMLKYDLQLMKKGSRSVAEYGRQFKALCDQLAAIGHPVDDTDKAHWFLRGLGPSFSSFSVANMALTPLPSFRDLLSKAESFSIFQESLDTSSTPPAAFTAHQDISPPRESPKSHANTHGREHYARPPVPSSENLSQAFIASCNISPNSVSDWYLDTGASAHMTPEASNLDSYEPYAGSDRVVVASSHQGDSGKRSV
ncbi:hypothetical protein C2S51_001177 [Perilla frutescens var. frutescens]|nr:hypothetical protein C2S51_001177 [Perilla frutescens var. frutescens]